MLWTVNSDGNQLSSIQIPPVSGWFALQVTGSRP